MVHAEFHNRGQSAGKLPDPAWVVGAAKRLCRRVGREFWFRGVVVFVFLAGILGHTASPAPTKPVVRSASEYGYPPFCMVEPDGNVTGFSVELFRAALAAVGHDATFRTGPWNEVKSWLEQGEVDALPLVGKTPERESVFDFTFPYLTLHGAIVVREGTMGIHSVQDLAGHRVEVMRGDNAEEFLRGTALPLDLHTTDTFETALRDLSAGTCDAVVIQHLLAHRLIRQTGLTNLHIVERPLAAFVQNFCFAVKDGDRDTLALLNEGLALVMADGTFRRLYGKWFAALEVDSQQVILVGGDSNYPPYEFLDKNGRPAGYNVDLTRAIAKEAGFDVQIRLTPWNETRHALEYGEIDAVQGMFFSPERSKEFSFSQPHTVVQHVAVARQGTGSPPATVAEMAGKRVAVMRGDIMHDFLNEQGLGDQAVPLPSQEEALRQVANGQCDCALVARIPALYWIRQRGWKNLVVAEQPLLSSEYSYAVGHNRQTLLALLSEGLKTVEENGEYRRIQQKWLGVYGGDKGRFGTILSYVALGATPLLLALGASLVWSRSLRRQVALRTAELGHSQAMLLAALSTSQAGIVIADAADGTIRFVNQAALDIRGGTGKELVDGIGTKDYSRVWRLFRLDGDPYPENEDPLSRAMREGETSSNEVVIRHEDGGERVVWANAAPIRDSAGGITAGIVVFQDITAHKQAEQAVQQSEANLKRILNSVSFGVIIISRDRVIRHANRTAVELAGYSSEQEMAGQTCNGALCSQADGQCPLLDVHEGIDHAERMLHTKDGRNIPVLLSAIPIHLNGEELLLESYVDISQLKETENALKRSQARYESLVEAIPDLVWLKDPGGVYLGCNATFCRLYDATEAEIVGKTDYDYVSKELADFFRDHDRKAMAAGRPSANEEWLTFSDTGYRGLFETIKTPIRDVDGSLLGVLGIARDITARAQAQAALRDSEDRYRALVEHAPVAIMVKRDDRLTLANEACLRLFGATDPEQLLGKSPYDLFHPDSHAAIRDWIVRRPETDKAMLPIEGRITRLDGASVEVEISAAPFGDREGKAIHVVLQDITGRKQAEEERETLREQLLQSQKMESVGRLAGGVAHDFNNKLMAILGYAELSQAEIDANHPLREYLDQIVACTRQSADLTRQLLAFARKQTINPQMLDLNDTVSGMLKMLQRLIGEDIRLVWRPGPGLWPVLMDPVQVDQLLANLSVNGRDAIGGVGTIEVETANLLLDEAYCAEHLDAVPGEYAVLSVADSGCGINPDVLPHIFEPFFTTKEAGQGTGLGLATVYGIVRQNNGFITVYSEPGQGTIFRIHLPHAVGEETVGGTEREPHEIPHGNETVLLVEDEQPLLRSTTLLLQRLGYTVIAVPTPSEAAQCQERIDVLLTDVVMPEMNGRELREQLRETHPDLRCVFMSGYTADIIAQRGVLDRGIHFLQKPFSLLQLARKMREALESPPTDG